MTTTNRETIALVGCVKSKRMGTHAARDLYTSALFSKRVAHVEAAGLRWWVLSAKYGLVAPGERIPSYDQTLNAMSTREREAWGARVVDQLRAAIGDLVGITFEIHAGARYVDAIGIRLRDAGASIEVPTAGLGLGKQLAWYGQRVGGRP